jgi:hypothetical protein
MENTISSAKLKLLPVSWVNTYLPQSLMNWKPRVRPRNIPLMGSSFINPPHPPHPPHTASSSELPNTPSQCISTEEEEPSTEKCSNRAPSYINNIIIIVAVYINNDNKNYKELIKCLTQLRRIYTNETIVAVDNSSLNNKWFEIAKSLDIIVLSNHSKFHRFEMGAYKYALQHYRSDKYIFIQGTIFLNNKLDLTTLNYPIPNATAFQLLDNFCWSDKGLLLINSLLKSIQMKPWNNDPLVLWNCFCCNNLFIDNMFKDKLFDLYSNTKEHSCAFERILGCYLKSKLKKINEIHNKSFSKIFLSQDIIKF